MIEEIKEFIIEMESIAANALLKARLIEDNNKEYAEFLKGYAYSCEEILSKLKDILKGDLK
jgi:hypothetical protein